MDKSRADNDRNPQRRHQKVCLTVDVSLSLVGDILNRRRFERHCVKSRKNKSNSETDKLTFSGWDERLCRGTQKSGTPLSRFLSNIAASGSLWEHQTVTSARQRRNATRLRRPRDCSLPALCLFSFYLPHRITNTERAQRSLTVNPSATFSTRSQLLSRAVVAHTHESIQDPPRLLASERRLVARLNSRHSNVRAPTVREHRSAIPGGRARG